MDSRRVVPGGLVVLLAGPLFSTCDNNKLTEGWALYAFGTGSKPLEDIYSSPGETWTDPTSGLTWQVTPTGGTMSWDAAKTHCFNLDLDGGGWHLPTIGELRTLIRGCLGTEAAGSCGVTDECLNYSECRNSSCEGCSDMDGPADGCYWPHNMQGTCGWYWSSSPVEGIEGLGWGVVFKSGNVHIDEVIRDDGHVRCVR